MPPHDGCPPQGPPSPEVTEAICRVPSAQFAQRLGILYQSTCVGFGYGLMQGLFPGTLRPRPQSVKGTRSFTSVTTCWLRNIHLIPIDYAFRPRLRGRLTLLRLTLSRNPWSFGERVSHPLYRYSCQHSHFRYLQQPSRVRLHRLTERSATTCLTAYPQLRCMALAPLHFRRKDPYLDQ